MIPFLLNQILQIGNIAYLTLREAARKKFIIVIVILSGFFLVFQYYCEANVKIGNQGQPPSMNIGLYLSFMLVSFWSMAISGLITSALISDEMENKTYIMILSKPVSRPAYLLGKFFGIFSLVLSNILIFLIIETLIQYIKNGSVNFDLIRAVFFMLPDFVLLISIVIALCIHLNRIAAVFLSLGIVIFTTIIDVPVFETSIGNSMNLNSNQRTILDTLYWALPQFGTVFFHSSSMITKSMAQLHNLGPWSHVQMTFYGILVWTIIIYGFHRKELD